MKVQNQEPKEWCNFNYKGVSMYVTRFKKSFVIWEIFSQNEGKGEVQEAIKELQKQGDVVVVGTIHPAIQHICEKLGVEIMDMNE